MREVDSTGDPPGGGPGDGVRFLVCRADLTVT
ncbi:hypothetical protein MSMEI_3421 [Mycolicibacterium smegmatis MC2 155]|uniref:Uncharacterized protein n=1 Tax=Mycolicibacterium smegmatis (strain ATCC 700084 / mc(2)155) TaxID=246196 RepID=I7GBI3_MYCS2|nr:hypothetical protein MSMEI_3421 [Mycolicibacterium smegmatis MC2 155]